MNKKSAENGQATKRQEQKEQTRQKLLDATVAIIGEDGLSNVTLAKVSERAGVSRGLCSFHFSSKEELMLEAFTMVYRQYEQAWEDAINAAGPDSAQKLRALIGALLSEPVADPRNLSVLVAFWGRAPHRRIYLEMCTESDRYYEETVEGLLRQLSDGQEKINGMTLRAIAVTLTSMIDGAHVQFLIAPGRLNSEEAINGCLAYLSSFFPEFTVSS